MFAQARNRVGRCVMARAGRRYFFASKARAMRASVTSPGK